MSGQKSIRPKKIVQLRRGEKTELRRKHRRRCKILKSINRMQKINRTSIYGLLNIRNILKNSLLKRLKLPLMLLP